MSQVQVSVRNRDMKLQMAVSDWIASRIEEDEVIAKTMDNITASCGRDCADEVSSWLFDIIGRSADIAAGLMAAHEMEASYAGDLTA